MSENRNGISSKTKISKGYRLKISTHAKIKELQAMTRANQDKVISRALNFYLKKLNYK